MQGKKENFWEEVPHAWQMKQATSIYGSSIFLPLMYIYGALAYFKQYIYFWS